MTCQNIRPLASEWTASFDRVVCSKFSRLTGSLGFAERSGCLGRPGRIAWVQSTLDGTARLGMRFEPDSPSCLAVLAELIGSD
jgi:hypothetical protein